jgi:hypothetical protein
MTEAIHLTPMQASALATVADERGAITVRQLAGEDDDDVYVTPDGSRCALRIAPDGAATPAGESVGTG